MQSWTLDALDVCRRHRLQAKKVFRNNRVFQCRCTKARPAKWLREESERYKQKRREQRNNVRVVGVAPEEQRPKPQA